MKASFFLKNVVMIIACFTAFNFVSCGNKSKTAAATTGDVKTTGAPSEQQASKDKKLPFERGSYVEESNAMGIDMKKTVYFDKWGEWTAAEQKMEMEIIKNYTTKIHKLEIVKGSTHWDLDLIKKTGTTYELSVGTTGMAAAIGAAMSGKVMEGTEIKDLGEEDYLGYKCKKTQIKFAKMEMDATVLAYGNLTMKMDGKMGKMDISTKITSIDLNTPLPDAIFEVPADVVVTKN